MWSMGYGIWLRETPNLGSKNSDRRWLSAWVTVGIVGLPLVAAASQDHDSAVGWIGAWLGFLAGMILGGAWQTSKSDEQPATQDRPAGSSPQTASDLLGAYARLLQDDHGHALLQPESQLPASKEAIKVTILAAVLNLRTNDVRSMKSVETLRSCYSLLSHFVSDDIAALTAQEEMLGSDPVFDDAFRASALEKQRLIAEFNDFVRRRSRIALP
ncbi:MAG TPA: hypothetical protein VFA27_12040 [Vicinamibacterales bacterium]|nr:hypothetical protein [Vicinamibacterales bacterium]